MATAGPKFPTSASGVGAALSGGGINWTNPTNIEAADSTFASVGLAAFAVSSDLIGQGYGFAIPSSATINGILAEVNCKSVVGSGSPAAQDFHVKLLKAGTLVGTDKAAFNAIPTGGITLSYGGSSDLWGTTWIPSDINDSGFGIDWVGWNDAISSSCSIDVDYIRITVTYTAGTNSSAMFQMF